MKLMSWNVNGIRAAARKGLLDWFGEERADVVCLQEIKAKPAQLTEELRHPPGYAGAAWLPAERPGYSGLVIYSREQPCEVIRGLGIPEIDVEGRVLLARFGDISLVNAYFPHVRHDHSRLDFKLLFCRELLRWLEDLRKAGHRLVVCGDFNIAHRDIDLANPRGNRRNAGFLSQEKAWMDRFLGSGFRDEFRERNPERGGCYTWWSNRKGVRERNVGWRIDYHCLDEALADRVAAVGHQATRTGSDHCPIFLELRD